MPLISAAAFLVVNAVVPVQQEPPVGATRPRGGQGRRGAAPQPDYGWPLGWVILGAPTDKSIGAAIHLKQGGSAYVEYGKAGGLLDLKSPIFVVQAGEPHQVTLAGLQPNQGYRYRILAKAPGQTEFVPSPEWSFQTQRATGTPFRFLVQGDSHPERTPKMHLPSLYERTLRTAEGLKPDFFICMGDDFSASHLTPLSREGIEGAYRRQVPYLGLIGRSAPLYLVNGNHEQASRANLDGTPNSLGVLAQTTRNRMYYQPAPDGFYTGNEEMVEHIGFLRNTFAWTWGDALFVVIDPYWSSEGPVDNEAGQRPGQGRGKAGRDLWNISLGDAQYRWLRDTLLESRAKYKFVFAHHVHGTGRGGVELAGLYEWGGRSRTGSNDFASKRPGWDMPIHQLFVKAGVSIFFQGHDHLFCRQELDGVIYQTCPTPADPTNSILNGDAYQTGDKVSGAGLVQVSVSPSEAVVEFLRSWEPSAETEGRKHGESAFRYSVKPRSAS